jgi:protein-S-isoprenylcysteine O-methyltransferase Ste14
MRPGLVISALWVGFAVSWLAAALWSGKTEKRARIGEQIPYRLVLLIGAILLAVPAHRYVGPLRLWSVTYMQAWICTAAITLGFAFSWWARIYLGPLWSSQVTRKENHRVIDSGPYGIVRHPIYTGILLAVFATAAAKGTMPGVGAALMIVLGFWMKARLEESWLRRELGADEYDAYRRTVPMLVPFGPKTR